MKKFFLAFILFSSLVFSQVPPYEFYCDISHSKLNVNVTYDSSRGVYIYSYEIQAGQQNTGYIVGLAIDISTKTKHIPKIDPSLNDNCSPKDWPNFQEFLSEYAIPVGLSRSDNIQECLAHKRTDATMAMQDIGAWAAWGGTSCEEGLEAPARGIEPGETFSGLIMEAKYPPGIRDFIMRPDETFCYSHIPVNDIYWDNDGEGWTRPKGWGKDEDHWLYGKTIGPVDPSEYEYYNGGGQKPDDVNLFLKYANPTEHSTNLPSGQNTFDLVIYYGSTISPSTFSAELNGQLITSLFSPFPGIAEVVHLQLQPGRNTLILKVDGKNKKGSTSTDTDRLVFIVK
mgnify:CR=1 FL=1